MAYVKTVWETGDVITAAKLNNAENGIEAANELVFEVSITEYTEAANSKATSSRFQLNKTYTEIKAAVDAGKIVIFSEADDADADIFGKKYYMLNSLYADSTYGYTVFTSTTRHFTSETADGLLVTPA